MEKKLIERDILAILDDQEQLSVVEIADVMGAHPVTVDRHCYQLHQNGHVRVCSGGIYSLTDDGENYLVQHRNDRQV